MRNGATAPRGSTSATFVRRVQATSGGRAAAPGSRRSGRRRSPRSEASTTPRTHVARGERPVPLVEVQRLGQNAPSVEERSPRAARSPARGGRARAARRAARGRPARCMPGIERRVDPQAALVDALAAVLPLEVLAHLLEEVRRDRGRVLAQVQAERAPPWPRPPPRGVTYFSSAMRSSTWLRRWRARARGTRWGTGARGFWGMPAMSAASARVRSLTDLPKKNRLAASTP